MKKLQLFWGRSTQNKIITTIVLLILLCCTLTICITIGISAWMLLDGTSTPTASLQENQNPEYEYMLQFNGLLLKYGELFDNKLTALGSEYDQNNDVFYDPVWQANMRGILDEADLITLEMENLAPVPDGFEELHRLTIKFAGESKKFTELFRIWLGTQDQADFLAIREASEEMLATLGKTKAELSRLENR